MRLLMASPLTTWSLRHGQLNIFRKCTVCCLGAFLGGREPGWLLKYGTRGTQKAVTNATVRRYLIVHHRSQSASLLGEARSLILTATGERAVECITVGVKHEVAIRGGAAVRQGHLAAIKDAVGAHKITDVILNFSTTGSHLSRISQALQPADNEATHTKIPVLVKDRTGIVLDIFRKHASSAEAQLQGGVCYECVLGDARGQPAMQAPPEPSRGSVNATLQGCWHDNLFPMLMNSVVTRELRYQATRVVRKRDQHGRLVFGIAGQEAEVVSARGRGGQGAVGGSGEKEVSVVGSRGRANISKVLKQLEEVQKRRRLLRAQRRKDGFATVALVGYTNAGKSTLMSALCKEDVGAADRLFATLDTKIRRVAASHGQKFLLVDTIGFIQGLPLQLVAAFQATLDEALQADLVVHVIDASSPSALQQRRTVLSALPQLGMSEHHLRTRTVEVWNKVDCLMPDAAGGASSAAAGGAAPHAQHSHSGATEDQQRLWQLVLNRLQQARSGARRARSEHASSTDSSSFLHQVCGEGKGVQSCSGSDESQHAVQRPAGQLSAGSVGGCGDAHHRESNAGAEACIVATQGHCAQSSSAGQDAVGEQQACDVAGEWGSGGWGSPQAQCRGEPGVDHGEGGTAEEESGSVGLWPIGRAEDGHGAAMADSTVVVAASTGLGLDMLTDVIAEQLKQADGARDSM